MGLKEPITFHPPPAIHHHAEVGDPIAEDEMGDLACRLELREDAITHGGTQVRPGVAMPDQHLLTVPLAEEPGAIGLLRSSQ
eukprot:8898084-Alexandrium_andersonii.AAC.1